MQNYIIRRLLLLVPTLLIVSIIVFLLVRWVPGSAVDALQALMSGTGRTGMSRPEIEHLLGMDVPAYIQYGKWIGNIILHGDFGNSLIQNRPVIQMVLERLPITIELALLAVIIDVLISLPLGVFSAIRQDTIGDYIFRTIAIILIAIPSFWLATLIMIYPSLWWGWAPPIELIRFMKDPIGNLQMFLLPALVLGTSTAGGTMRMTRTMMLEVMRQDYIKTAWAKGLNEKGIILRHALKNALIPVITILGGGLGMLIGGAVIIEQIFVLPGIGQLMLQALNQRDYPLVSAITMVTAVFVMVCNLLVDMSYNWLDPRIRYK